MTISLRDAKLTGRLTQFVEQETQKGIDPISRSVFDFGVELIVKAPLQQDQTSGSCVRGGSTGK